MSAHSQNTHGTAVDYLEEKTIIEQSSNSEKSLKNSPRSANFDQKYSVFFLKNNSKSISIKSKSHQIHQSL